MGCLGTILGTKRSGYFGNATDHNFVALTSGLCCLDTAKEGEEKQALNVGGFLVHQERLVRMAFETAHGFASMNGGTTGGSGGATVRVSTGSDLQRAIDAATSGSPLTIVVAGTITPENTGGSEITIDGHSNLSIVGDAGELDGIGLHIKGGSSNLIVQNLKIHDVATGGKDAIGIEGPSKNIWIDSNELSSSMNVSKDFYDGLLDIKRGAEYITVSNNYFHDHHKVSLVGYSDTDEGGRYVTYDHNRFENIGSRAPSVRDGYVHIYENYYDHVETSGINLRMGAVGLIENNVFANSDNPIVSRDSPEPGFWDLRGNVFENVTWSKPGAGEANGMSNDADTAHYDVPYSYSTIGADKVEGYVLAHAGTGHALAGNDSGATSPPPADAPASPVSTAPAPQDPAPVQAPDDGSTPIQTPGGTPTLAATGNADLLVGTSGDDRIDGRGGADTIDGGDGNDVMAGGTNDDLLSGGAGDDQLSGDAGNDTLSGGIGNDDLEGGGGKDTLNGDAGADRLSGGDANDILLGGDGADTLLGGAGNDHLTGGAGGDMLTGGDGKDVFVYLAASDSTLGAHDTITDFGLGDRIDLSAIDANPSQPGNEAFTWVTGSAFSGHAGELLLTEQDGASILSADLDGDGAADLQIDVAGPHLPGHADILL